MYKITWHNVPRDQKKEKKFEPIRSPHFRISIQNLQKTGRIKIYLQFNQQNRKKRKHCEIFFVFLRSRNFKHISFAIWWVIISHMTHYLWLILLKIERYLFSRYFLDFPKNKSIEFVNLRLQMQLGNRSRESMLPLTVKVPLKVTSALIRFNGPKNELRSAGKMSGSTLFFFFPPKANI